ncbi:hypothetical protein [Frankia sp. AgB32]|uniref:hypothetical protein n=1 Tax=Frankia sp. AgB32 TaxID=631119 RepID=UPI00200EABCA|nr:hypothetical protein [Frankia sp. AgB32]MCK9897449.1 hypothetical protein [Frankia sp. AgB32]
MLRSLLGVLEDATLLVLPHGGQKTARRNAWRAAADLHVTRHRWVDPLAVTPRRPADAAALAADRVPTQTGAAAPSVEPLCAVSGPVRLARRAGRPGNARVLPRIATAPS